MKQTITIEGNNSEEKFSHLEIILARMFRRLHQTAIGVMPKLPIMGYTYEAKDDIIVKYVIPCDCKLVMFDAFVGIIPEVDGKKINPAFRIVVKRYNQEMINKVYYDEEDTSVKLDLNLLYGDVLCLMCSDSIADISHTFVFEFSEDMFSAQNFDIEKLEALTLEKV